MNKYILIAEIIVILLIFISYRTSLHNEKKKCLKCGRNNAMREYDKDLDNYYLTNNKNSYWRNIYKVHRRCRFCGNEDTRVRF